MLYNSITLLSAKAEVWIYIGSFEGLFELRHTTVILLSSWVMINILHSFQ